MAPTISADGSTSAFSITLRWGDNSPCYTTLRGTPGPVRRAHCYSTPTGFFMARDYARVENRNAVSPVVTQETKCFHAWSESGCFEARIVMTFVITPE